MTTSVRPSKKTFEFLKEVQTTLPNCYYWERQNYTLKEICDYAPTKQYTDLVIFRENRRKVNEVIMIHLPHGPTAIFKLTSMTLNKGK
jgi:rRNA maturation protein Rpf1